MKPARDRLRGFLQFAIAQCWLFSFTFFLKPEWYESGAYQRVDELITMRGAGFIWLILAVWGALYYHRIIHSSIWYWVGLYSFLQVLFAWSIFSLTWKGSQGAFVGAVMWGGYAYFGFRALILTGSSTE